MGNSLPPFQNFSFSVFCVYEIADDWIQIWVLSCQSYKCFTNVNDAANLDRVPDPGSRRDAQRLRP